MVAIRVIKGKERMKNPLKLFDLKPKRTQCPRWPGLAAAAGLCLRLLFFPSPHGCQAAEIVVEPVVSGLSNPVAITHAGDGSGRLFVTLQAGQVLVWDGSQLLFPPFLDISSLVLSGGERGLLSVAFHHDYETNGFFFVNYTRAPTARPWCPAIPFQPIPMSPTQTPRSSS